MPVEKKTYVHEVFACAKSPYATWLRHTDEKDRLVDRLPGILARMRFGRAGGGRRRILDVGCASGHTSMRILGVLDRIGIEAEYVAIDPYREQLDLFRARLDETGRRDVTLARSPLETFDAPAGSFDLVVASHSLYYVPDVADAARRIRTLGKEALVVHHGPRGIDEVHRAFPALVRRQGFVVSTYDDVLPHFPGATLRSFTGTVDVAPCHDPASEDGLDLVSFFLERDARALPPEARAKIAAWFRARFPAGTMAHDVGVIS